jgi:catechol 2,3-dioxygenase-like lactoylglutathione lyase family enzyme
MIAVKDIAYVRFQTPDLDAMQQFLLDFGLHTALRTDDRLYMRCAGPQPFVHVTHRGSGEVGVGQGLGFWAQSLGDLRQLAEATGSPLLDNEEPGGGKVVRLTSPDGLLVDVLYGQQMIEPLPTRAVLPHNPGGAARQRKNITVRHPRGPSTVLRLGHAVLRVGDYATSRDWFTQTLGLRVADSVYVGEPDNHVFSFMRCGLGQQLTDHHTLAIAQMPIPLPNGIDHSAFEVLDFDDVLIGNEHLKSKDYRHSWGVGRHAQGSQVFDYWRDPNGTKTEHWADGDSINDDYPVGNMPMEQMIGNSIWAPDMPEDFIL